jgi:hypothetical protein
VTAAVATIPKLLVSSVVRGAQQGDSHGGLYVVDIVRGEFEQVIDWNTSGIDWEGRGADRGLRGIVISGKDIFVAASDELFVYDPWFRQVASYRNPYLKHCHEMSLHNGKLYITTTGFDAIVRFDLKTRRFDLGIAIVMDGRVVNVKAFDPNKPGAHEASNVLHINNVHVDDTGVYVSGRKMPALVQITRTSIVMAAGLPRGTHNARPFRGGVLFNDTDSDSVVWLGPKGRVAIRIPQYDPKTLTHMDVDASGIARQGFGRGLCVISDTLVAAGSSPTTVSIHDLEAEACIQSINLSIDVRNAAHGMAIWPF